MLAADLVPGFEPLGVGNPFLDHIAFVDLHCLLIFSGR